MNNDYIREFCVLADIKKYTEAAELCYISPSSLSKHIKSLEDELGQKLFFRTAHNVVLTEFGEAYLPYAKEIGEIQMKLYNNLLSTTKSTSNVIRVGISSIVSICDLFQDKLNLSKKGLGYTIEIIGSHNRHLRKLLLTNQCDFIITTDCSFSDYENFNVLEYMTDSLQVIFSDNCPLVQKKNVKLSDLKSIPYVQISHDNILTSLNFTAKTPDFVVPNFNIALDFLTHSQGFTVCPSSLIKLGLPSGLHAVSLQNTDDIPLYLFYNKVDPLNSDNKNQVNFLNLIMPNLRTTSINEEEFIAEEL